MQLLVVVVLLMSCCTSCNGQRLSQGASDWYMRFHSNYVKRNVDRPVTRSFEVTSTVRHRYAITEVRTVIHNPANVPQDFNFGLVMPETAFVSNVTVVRHGSVNDLDIVTGMVNESEWMYSHVGNEYDDDEGPNGDHEEEEEEEEEHEVGANGGQQHQGIKTSEKLVDFKQFVLPIKLRAHDDAILTVVYEYMLERRGGKYHHDLTLSPGETVKDFLVRLTVSDERPLVGVKVTAPVMGEIDGLVVGQEHIFAFNMSQIEQGEFYGQHGFTGVLKMEYRVVTDDQPDVVVEDDFFAHFYKAPNMIRSIPTHATFLLDTSASTAKMSTAKAALRVLLSNLGARDFVNVILFNSTGLTEFTPSTSQEVEQVFACTNSTVEAALEFVASSEEDSNGNASQLASGLERASQLGNHLWSSGLLPDNVASVLVVLTDGLGLEEDAQRLKVVKAAESSGLPIVALGIGFDAKMDLLEAMSSASIEGGFVENIVEDEEVESQLRLVNSHLHDVIIKNLEVEYEGEAVEETTYNKVKAFHKGSALAVSGRFGRPRTDLVPNMSIKVTGHSAKGVFSRKISFVPDPSHYGCKGHVLLCSQPNLEGECHKVTRSHSRLSGFAKKAASMKVYGSCAWQANVKPNHRGTQMVFMEGSYEGLPGSMDRKIASIKVLNAANSKVNLEMEADDDNMDVDNKVARLWAYMTIRDTLHMEQNNLWPDMEVREDSLSAAFDLCMAFNFLTPLTDMYLKNKASLAAEAVEPDNEAVVQNNRLTYNDLSPIFFQMDDPDTARQWNAFKTCQEPIVCEGHFHMELYEEEEDNLNCTGSLVLYAKSAFYGDSLNVTSGLYQVYHTTNAQRMRSYESSGDCCWLIFDHRFFVGDVARVCGPTKEPLRKKNHRIRQENRTLQAVTENLH